MSIVTGLSGSSYAMQVTNANGGVSIVLNLTVNAPAVPSITSLAPNPMTHSSATQSLTINGANFQNDTGLKVTVGTVTYSGSQVAFVSATQLKVSLVLSSASASTSVQVTNPSGAASNLASLTVN